MRNQVIKLAIVFISCLNIYKDAKTQTNVFIQPSINFGQLNVDLSTNIKKDNGQFNFGGALKFRTNLKNNFFLNSKIGFIRVVNNYKNEENQFSLTQTYLQLDISPTYKLSLSKKQLLFLHLGASFNYTDFLVVSTNKVNSQVSLAFIDFNKFQTKIKLGANYPFGKKKRLEIGTNFYAGFESVDIIRINFTETIAYPSTFAEVTFAFNLTNN